MHILIVDDEIPVATLLAEAVAGQGHEVSVALSGLDVLRAIRTAVPDLVVVVITGHAGPGERQAARRLGVADVVEKPLCLSRLNEALATLAPQRRGRTSLTSGIGAAQRA